MFRSFFSELSSIIITAVKILLARSDQRNIIRFPRDDNQLLSLTSKKMVIVHQKLVRLSGCFPGYYKDFLQLNTKIQYDFEHAALQEMHKYLRAISSTFFYRAVHRIRTIAQRGPAHKIRAYVAPVWLYKCNIIFYIINAWYCGNIPMYYYYVLCITIIQVGTRGSRYIM